MNKINTAELPKNRNFDLLKASGLAIIKKLSGNEWTNYNESDPGITILDQLCYALTELGYCNNFPIEDILCQSNGEIDFDEQFYSPEKILTSGPVSINDYRKLIFDSFPDIKNVYIKMDDKNKQYRVYLYIDKQKSKDEDSEILNKTKILLNKNRNIGESFAEVKQLDVVKVVLHGDVYIDTAFSPLQVLADIKQAVDNYISPQIKQYGYDEMQGLGYSSDEIFNGPILKNGWIPDSEMLVDRRKKIKLQDLNSIITNTLGVSKIDKLSWQCAKKNSPTIAEVELEQLNLIHKNKLVEQQVPLQLHAEIAAMQNNHQAKKIGASIDLSPALPQGNYRNISEYYSVQNTFPSFYGIGFDALPANSSDYRMAQAQQLKGYLMVFDQLLANQFSQLANVSQLFSFKLTNTTADEPYKGMPYQQSPSTYYCQALYNIPNVKPLLIGSDSYNFSFSVDDPRSQELVWKDYKKDPFNQYMHGLRSCMESDASSDERRERMLNHLLARHGESSDFFDSLITQASWYGSLIKSRIIIKSLLLQNYALLSYHRNKAYSFLSAEILGSPGRYRLTQESYTELGRGGLSAEVMTALRAFINIGYASKTALTHALMKAAQKSLSDQQIINILWDGNEQKSHAFTDEYSDGQLNLNCIEKKYVWRCSDFDNFSAFELRLNLIFGLSECYESLSNILLILIESGDLSDWLEPIDSADKITTKNNVCSDLDISIERKNSNDLIKLNKQTVLNIEWPDNKTPASIDLYQGYKDQLDWLARQRQGFIFVESQLFNISKYALKTQSVFPDYINLVNKDLFKQNFYKLERAFFPAHVRNDLHFFSFERLQKTIPEYRTWHNDLLKPFSCWGDQEKNNVEVLIKNLSSDPGEVHL
ncbi:MAG: hypothetical protein KUG80_02430 [Gammaproteobacteria bacterium]|nr:hypothetical protein [Gammaproteobacteria bacterium]